MRQKCVVATLVLAMIVVICGCGMSKRSIRIGIVISDEISEAYRQMCYDGIKKMQAEMKLKDGQIAVIDNANANNCYALVLDLVENGYSIIIGFGAGVEDSLVQNATENSKVQFFMAYGTQSTIGLENYHCFAPTDYQARYIAGVAAGGPCYAEQAAGGGSL